MRGNESKKFDVATDEEPGVSDLQTIKAYPGQALAAAAMERLANKLAVIEATGALR